MMNNEYETLESKLETFNNYIGVPNGCLLANLNYVHFGENIIKCLDCNHLFISFCWDTDFFEKHRISRCIYLHKDLIYNCKKKHKQSVDNWLKKKQILDFIKHDFISSGDCKNYLEKFLEIKGDYGSVRLFKDYLVYSKYFMKDRNLVKI